MKKWNICFVHEIIPVLQTVLEGLVGKNVYDFSVLYCQMK